MAATPEQRKAINRRYNAKPEVQAMKAARAKAYNERPDVRSKLAARARSAEARAWQKAYYEKNRDAIRAKQKAGRTKPGVKEARSRQSRERRAKDPEFKILRILRRRLENCLKTGGPRGRTKDLIGCTIPELRAHLESLFKPGMNWSNHGFRGWHIDHIRPCAAFNMLDVSEQRRCFHFTNMQPLWWLENMQKNDKLS